MCIFLFLRTRPVQKVMTDKDRALLEKEEEVSMMCK